jgi:hypothetical protein
MRRKPVDHATLNPSSAATSLLNPLIYDHLLVMLPSIPPSVLQLGLLSGMHHNRYQKGQRRLHPMMERDLGGPKIAGDHESSKSANPDSANLRP